MLTSAQYVYFRILVNGVAVNGRGISAQVGGYNDFFGESNNLWEAGVSVVVPVTAGVGTTIKVQWDFSSLFNNTVYCYPATQDQANRNLIILE